MFKLKRVITVIIMTVVLAIMLSGCGNLKMDIKLNPDNTSTVTLEFMTIDISPSKTFIDDAKEYLTTKGYAIENKDTTESGVGLLSFVAKKDFSDISKLSDDIKYLYSKLPYDNKGDVTAEIKNNIGLYNSKTFNVKLPLSNLSIDTILKNLSAEDRETINKVLGVISASSGQELAMDDDSLKELSKQGMSVIASISSQDENFSTNEAYFYKEDPKTALWQFIPMNDESVTLSMTKAHKVDENQELKMNNSMVWVSETPNIIAIVLISVLILALIIFLIVKFGRKPKKNEEVLVESQDETDSALESEEFEDFSDVDTALEDENNETEDLSDETTSLENDDSEEKEDSESKDK